MTTGVVHGRSEFKSFVMFVLVHTSPPLRVRCRGPVNGYLVAGDGESKRCVQVEIMDGRR